VSRACRRLCVFTQPGPEADIESGARIRFQGNSPARPGEPRYTHIAHGDLLTHEIRLGTQGFFVHEILFERGSNLLIEFSGFSHLEEILDAER
jgi:hypothetical protein